MSTPFLAGLAVAAAALAGRYGIQAWQAFKTRPPKPRVRRFYDGGFQPTMTKREAALILGIRIVMAKAEESLTFTVWCLKNFNGFWRTNSKGVAVALNDVSLPIFRSIANVMKVCHSKNRSWGALVEDLIISNNSVTLKSLPTKLSSYHDRNAQIVRDLEIFHDVVSCALQTTFSVSPFQTQDPPKPVERFFKQFQLLKYFASNSAKLKENATPDKVKEAHRRVMVANHPDAGGSHYLASKINEAKDVMLGKTKGSGSAF